MEKIFVILWILLGIYILVLLMIYLEIYYQTSLWLFPFITFFMAIVLCLIEIKSIREKAEDKVRLDRAEQAIQQVFINRENLEEVAKTISEYMSENSNKAESSEKTQTSDNEQQ